MVDKQEWIEVHFYGLVPAGQALISVELAEIGATLMKTFGFTYIDKITIMRVGSHDLEEEE